MFQAFSPDTLDRILALEQRYEERGLLDGHVYSAMIKYFKAMFAADTLGLTSPERIWQTCEDAEPEMVGWEPVDPEQEAYLVAGAYVDYVVEMAWSGPGIPVRDWDHERSAEMNDVIIEHLQYALAIADKLGVDTGQVIEYYRTRAEWMPTPGTTWTTVRERAQAEGRWAYQA